MQFCNSTTGMTVPIGNQYCLTFENSCFTLRNMTKQKIAIVGLGSRASMYVSAITQRYADSAELVGLCDVNPGRVALYNGRLHPG